MLTGEYQHTVDSKGRVFIPAKFRTDLGQNVTIAVVFGDYIMIYSDEEWIKYIEKLDALRLEGRFPEEWFREVMRSAQSLEVDSQGRIVIAEKLRKAAGLDKDVTFIGMRNHAEIWSDEKLGISDSSKSDISELRKLNKELHLGLG